jgi:hypothetical protein
MRVPKEATGSRMKIIYALSAALAMLTCSIFPACAGSSDAREDRWIIDAAHSVGGITPRSTQEDVAEVFGSEHVEAWEVPVGEGMTVEGTRVYGGTENELLIEWKNSGTPKRIRISGRGTDWQSREGITVGSSLETVEAVNGKPFLFTGFGWDYGGRTVSWEGGALPPELQLAFEPPESLPENEKRHIMGDKMIRSDFRAVDTADFRVKDIFVRWSDTR